MVGDSFFCRQRSWHPYGGSMSVDSFLPPLPLAVATCHSLVDAW
jgi:hypothetical protein